MSPLFQDLDEDPNCYQVESKFIGIFQKSNLKLLEHQHEVLHVWRSKGESFNSVIAVKHGGGSIMVLCCFGVIGSSTLHKQLE